MSRTVVKTGVSLPRKLVEDLDSIIKKLGLPSRSHAVAEAVLRYVADYSWLLEREGEVAGAIGVLYEHDRPNIAPRLTSIQHEFLDIIKSTIHMHLDEHRCLELILVHGRLNKVKELVKKLESVPGILITKNIIVKL